MPNLILQLAMGSESVHVRAELAFVPACSGMTREIQFRNLSGIYPVIPASYLTSRQSLKHLIWHTLTFDLASFLFRHSALHLRRSTLSPSTGVLLYLYHDHVVFAVVNIIIASPTWLQTVLATHM